MHVIRKLVAALALAGACSVASGANNLVIEPAVSSVGPADSFILQVLGMDFADIVVGGGFDLSFDADILKLDSVTINTVLWDWLSSGGTINNEAGTLSNVYFNALANSPTDDFVVATLGFTAKAAGTGAVTLSASNIFKFSDFDGNEIDVNFGTGSITAVPEPAVVATMLFGLALLGLVRLRRQVDLA